MSFKKMFNTLLIKLKLRKPKKLEPVPLQVENGGELLVVKGRFCLNEKEWMLTGNDDWELFYIEMYDEERLI
jgi:hypothetical protein